MRGEWDMAYIPLEKLICLGGYEFLYNFKHGSKKSYTVSGIQNGCHIPLPVNHSRGIWDHIHLVIVASDALRMYVRGLSHIVSEMLIIPYLGLPTRTQT